MDVVAAAAVAVVTIVDNICDFVMANNNSVLLASANANVDNNKIIRI